MDIIIKKRKARIILCALLAVLILLSSTNYSFAGSHSVTSSGQSFSKEWGPKTSTAANGSSKITYGFNTVLLNEDYCHTWHSSANHRAKLQNTNGIFYGAYKSPNVTSKIEVRHSGTYITYSNEWQ